MRACQPKRHEEERERASAHECAQKRPSGLLAPLFKLRGFYRANPVEGNGNSLQYSCLDNSTDRGAWRAIVHGVTKESDMNEAT